MDEPTTPADRPADQLRAAAEKLRAAAAAVPSDDWGTRPWHVEECSDTDTMESCPCIVAQGEHKEFDQPQVPMIQYVADAETTEHAAWIALMHPGVGLPVARWLESWAGVDLSEYGPMPEDAQHAVAVARQLLGTSVAAECGCDPAPHREDDGTYSHWAGCPIADEQQAADASAGLEPDAELRDRIADAIRAESSRVDDVALADAVMPVVTDRLRRNWGEMRDRVAELETEAQRLVDAAPPAPADRAAVLRVVDRLAAHAVGFQDVLDESDRGPWGELILADIADLRALAAGAAPAPRCPRCNEDLTDYTDDDRVYRTGDTRPYCSGECVVFAYRRKLPIPSWADDAAAGVQPPTNEADTLAPWLYQRFMAAGAGWDQLDEDDRSYWEHHARAVRRAVARGGFNGMDPSHLLGVDQHADTHEPAAPAAPEETQ
ncbi:hypothetical protein ABZ329_29645 [Streptomyces rubiginosohelvolus]|uniref:hypothetical protein n=1 Tax=Streptomyces rubiginosohelvolus TaxID=67362 RepID=UPI0033C28C1E